MHDCLTHAFSYMTDYLKFVDYPSYALFLCFRLYTRKLILVAALHLQLLGGLGDISNAFDPGMLLEISHPSK